MNKKGDIQSIIVAIVMVFIGAILVIIFSKGFLEIVDELQVEAQFSNNTNAMEGLAVVEDNTIHWLDFAVFFVLVSLILGLIISSLFIDVHPAIAIIFFIVLIVAVFLAGQFANIYAEITQDSELIDTSSHFTMTNLILGNKFPLIVLVTGIIVILILYGKSKRGGVGSQPI